jgi:hypothetical protein
MDKKESLQRIRFAFDTNLVVAEFTGVWPDKSPDW